MKIADVLKKLAHIATFGLAFANKVKEYEDSPLLQAVVAATSTKADDAVLATAKVVTSGAIVVLEETIKALNWAELKLSSLKDDEKAIVLHVINAVATKAESGVNIQTALTAPQLSYNSDAVNV